MDTPGAASGAVDDKTRLEAVEKELDFYRKRQLAVYYFAVLAQVLVVTGDRYVCGVPPRVAATVYVLFFLGVSVFAWQLGKSYSKRIWYVRERRLELVRRTSDIKPLLPTHDTEFRSISPSWLYTSLIFLLSVVGIMLTIGGRTPGDCS